MTMTHEEEIELFRLVKENNYLLKLILKYTQHDEANDFMTNIVANVLGNRLDGGNNYARR